MCALKMLFNNYISSFLLSLKYLHEVKIQNKVSRASSLDIFEYRQFFLNRLLLLYYGYESMFQRKNLMENQIEPLESLI